MKSNLQNGAAGNLSGNGPVGFYINRHITSFGKYNKFDNGSDSHNFELVGRVVKPALWFYQIQ